MIRWKRRLGGLLLLAALLSLAETGIASEKPASRGDKVLLSLRIAGAKRQARGVEYYRSVVRQRKGGRTPGARTRPATDRPRPAAR